MCRATKPNAKVIGGSKKSKGISPTYQPNQPPTYQLNQPPTYQTNQPPPYHTNQSPTYHTNQPLPYNTNQPPTPQTSMFQPIMNPPTMSQNDSNLLMVGCLWGVRAPQAKLDKPSVFRHNKDVDEDG
ncbi:hypothetical protein Lal_00042192 [Lupinus albus]|nr:hypothetical protein Lal_00042192 [Lupinus albus]